MLNGKCFKLFKNFLIFLLLFFGSIRCELWVTELDSGLSELSSINVTFTIITPERAIRKTQGDGVFGCGIVLGHMALDVTGAGKGLAFETNPVFVGIFALMALELWEMFRVFVEEEFGEILNFLLIDMRTIKFRLDCESGLFRGCVKGH